MESTGDQIIENARDFGWDENEKYLNVIEDDKIEKLSPFVNIYGSEHTIEWDNKASNVNIVVGMFAKLTQMPYTTTFEKKIKDLFEKMGINSIKKMINKNSSQVLVIDSLNIIPESLREMVFLKLLEPDKKIDSKKQPNQLKVFILDGNPDGDNNPFWEYMCDTVIELNYHKENNYLIRTIEIVKSRFQGHVWGTHQLKILNKPQPNPNPNTNTPSRLHPSIEEGGIYIFPSVHFYLSKYKKFANSKELKYSASYPHSFTKFLPGADKEGGFPLERCTALIGCRGGHKSHLGYLHILSRLTANYTGGIRADASTNAALIISLRDDEPMIIRTLDTILKNEFPKEGWTTEQFIEEGRLEILYYPPGYISPEEFVHRTYVSIHKLKQGGRNVTVLFNSLDQLAARFPLCAKLDIFIPCIIQILVGEATTSIFIAVDEKDQPEEQYGLLPMADLILSFHKYQISMKDYYASLNTDDSKEEKYDKSKLEEDKNRTGSETQTKEIIVLKVERFAGGKNAGSKGLLELGNSNFRHNRNIINFIELPPNINIDKSSLVK
jgi:hypothetical protein